MIIPVRCFSCGKPIAQVWEEFKKQVAEGKSAKEILDSLGIDRYCCRSVFLGQEDLIELVSNFKKS
jgi:DNA-directed RNA polymerase subunit N (RpoN/RPB10)